MYLRKFKSGSFSYHPKKLQEDIVANFDKTDCCEKKVLRNSRNFSFLKFNHCLDIIRTDTQSRKNVKRTAFKLNDVDDIRCCFDAGSHRREVNNICRILVDYQIKIYLKK